VVLGDLGRSKVLRGTRAVGSWRGACVRWHHGGVAAGGADDVVGLVPAGEGGGLGALAEHFVMVEMRLNGRISWSGVFYV